MKRCILLITLCGAALSASLPIAAKALFGLALLTALTTRAHAAVTNVAWYRLGENDPGAGSGQAVTGMTTDIATANHLQPFGGPLYTDAISADAAVGVGSSLALQFNGASQFLSNALVSTATDNYGLEAWVNSSTDAFGIRRIALNGSDTNGWGLIQNGAFYSAMLPGTPLGGLLGQTTVATGTWTHLALVRESGTNRFFVNGVLNAFSTAAPVAPNGVFAVGGRPFAPASQFFNGSIDEVRVFRFAAGQFSTNDLLVNVRRITTIAATGVGPTNATVNGSVHPVGFPTSAWFEWGMTTNYGNVTPPQALGNGTAPTNFSQILTGLFGGIHHFRAVASNGLGVVLGGNESFTLQPPARVVINELVKDRRSATGGQVAETREFVELYNAGTAAVNLSGWFVRTANLADGAEPFHIFIPAGTSLGPGSFYVIGQTSVPKVNLDLGTVEIWPDARPLVFELCDNTETLVDAVACDLYRTNSLGSFATPEQIAQFGAGFYGNLISTDVAAPNAVQSWGRWLDGRDTDNNGRDLGIIPVTPGTANNLPQVLAHSVFDLSGLAHGSPVPGYFASFVMPRAIDPGTVDSVNPRAIAAPPGGGKAIIAWDHTGGGNATYSRELVRGFVLRVYLDTGPLGITGATASSTETTVYGIGTTDAFFNNPDPTGTIFTSDALLQNGSTGIGWLYQRRETTNGTGNFSKLFLVDFGPGGNPRPMAAGGSWNIIQELNIATLPPGWYRLNVHYDPPTGEVLAIFGDQTFIFTTAPGLLGTFCVGYRTAINNFANNLGAHDPPTFIVQSPPAPRPALLIERIAPTQVRLLWPTNAVGFTLQSNTNLNTTNWISAVAPPSVVSTNHVSLDSTTNRQRFYRLFHP